MNTSLPLTGFLRLTQIIGDTKRGISPIIPVSKSTWWAGVKSGRFPKPIKISARCVAWRADDVEKLLKRLVDEKQS